MINISFDYVVTAVNQQARVMEVVYTATGFNPILVGVRLPEVGESVDEVIRTAAPLGIWEAAQKVFAEVPVGTTGVLTIAPMLPETTTAEAPPEIFSLDPAVVEAQESIQRDAIKELIREVLNEPAV